MDNVQKHNQLILGFISQYLSGFTNVLEVINLCD
jgi:hypothetical protein